MKKKVIIGIFLILLLVVGSVLITKSNNTEFVSKKENTTNTYQMIEVRIIGEVNYPGLYIIEKGSRVIDLISLAGGLTQFADNNSYNPLKQLSDSETINIKRQSLLNINNSLDNIYKVLILDINEIC